MNGNCFCISFYSNLLFEMYHISLGEKKNGYFKNYRHMIRSYQKRYWNSTFRTYVYQLVIKNNLKEIHNHND